ncbi:MAG: TetR/AcrR family transcriptional regulator [Syntrophomonas sp.]|nr:TetR/AcrR family transcriptional regulator [Syntrophomonadaceae bacterium]
MNKRRYEGEQTKINIANNAKTLFSRKGYSGTSIQDICSAAGCSKGNLYYHFKSKEELFLYLEEQASAEWLESLEEIFSCCETFTEKLYAYGDFASKFERPLYSAERDFINNVGLDSEAGKKYIHILDRNYDRFQQFIAEGITSGEIKNEGLFELTFIASSYFSALNHYSSYYCMDNETLKNLFRKATKLLLHGISTAKKG